jgi:heterodisulfide reductase subunit A-like polyferredoxin
MKKQDEKKNMSRRKFITLAGGAASFAAISAMGINADWALNDPEIDIDALGVDKMSADVLVIGSGMAGLFAAVKAHDAGAKVVMVS